MFNDIVDPVSDGVGLAGFTIMGNAFHRQSHFIFYYFPLNFILSMSLYCVLHGVFDRSDRVKIELSQPSTIQNVL